MGVRLAMLEQSRREMREDLIELSMITYGIMNIDEWRIIIANIVTSKVNEFDLTADNKMEMRKRINGFLTKMVTDLEGRFQAENKGVVGSMRTIISDFVGVFDKIKRDVPQFTDEIMVFLEDKKNRDDVRNFILEKIEGYADNTFSETDYSLHDQIIATYGFETRDETIVELRSRIAANEARSAPYIYGLLAVFVGVIIWLIAVRPKSRGVMTALVICSLVPLTLGLFLPMIEIDARVAELRFQLLGEPIVFADQVIYYKSKSIIEVVQLMLRYGKADLVAVGILVLAFSVIFPLSKLIASIIYLYHAPSRHNKVLRFLAFKTGKWSMADVLVIAIFMAYIGFSGIVTEQLKVLQGMTKSVDLLTTNNSSLQTGFFMFTAFVLISLMIAQRIPDVVDSRIMAEKQKP